MSKILNETGYRELSHMVECNGKKYFVDSNDTFDHGYETMVFNVLKNDKIDWLHLYVERYSSYEKMEKQHYIICNNLENYINIKEK